MNDYITRDEFQMFLEALQKCRTMRQVRGACMIAATDNQAEMDADPFRTALTDKLRPIPAFKVPQQRRKGRRWRGLVHR